MKHSIRKTVTRNFVALILLTVSLLDLALIFGFREYTYGGVKFYLNQQLDSAVYTYDRYFKSRSIDELLDGDYDMIFNQFGGQVQMIDKDAQLVYDSIGAINDPVKDYPDVVQALVAKSTFASALCPIPTRKSFPSPAPFIPMTIASSASCATHHLWRLPFVRCGH